MSKQLDYLTLPTLGFDTISCRKIVINMNSTKRDLHTVAQTISQNIAFRRRSPNGTLSFTTYQSRPNSIVTMNPDFVLRIGVFVISAITGNDLWALNAINAFTQTISTTASVENGATKSCKKNLRRKDLLVLADTNDNQFLLEITKWIQASFGDSISIDEVLDLLKEHGPVQRVVANHIQHHSFFVEYKSTGHVQALLDEPGLITRCVNNKKEQVDLSPCCHKTMWANAWRFAEPQHKVASPSPRQSRKNKESSIRKLWSWGSA